MRSTQFSITAILQHAFSVTFEYFFFFLLLSLSWFASVFSTVIIMGVILFWSIRAELLALVYEKLKMPISGSFIDQASISRFSEVLAGYSFLPVLLFLVGVFIVYHFFSLGFMRAIFEVNDNKQSSLTVLFSQKKLLLRALAVYVIYYFLCILGAFFFIIPAFIAATTYGLAPYILVDQDCGIFEAFKKSAALTCGERRYIFALMFLLSIFRQFAVGIFAPVSFFILWPVVSLSYVRLYRSLQANSTQS